MKRLEGRLEGVIRGDVRSQELLARHTSFRIGGPADFWIEPTDLEDLKVLVRFLRANGVAWIILGNGTNVLFADCGFSGVVISLSNFDSLSIKEDCLIAGAGLSLQKLLEKTVGLELGGLEFVAGIPGTVGGAVITNAGGRTGEIGRVVKEITVVDSEVNTESISRTDLGFGYRSCQISRQAIIVEVEVELTKGEKGDIRGRISEVLNDRKDTQPLDYPSAGCIFKNRDGKSAGELIASAGLAGKRIGDAEISTRHANFIINTGKARASDVISLIELVEERLSRRYGIELERELTVIK